MSSRSSNRLFSVFLLSNRLNHSPSIISCVSLEFVLSLTSERLVKWEWGISGQDIGPSHLGFFEPSESFTVLKREPLLSSPPPRCPILLLLLTYKENMEWFGETLDSVCTKDRYLNPYVRTDLRSGRTVGGERSRVTTWIHFVVGRVTTGGEGLGERRGKCPVRKGSPSWLTPNDENDVTLKNFKP